MNLKQMKGTITNRSNINLMKFP